VQGIFYSAVAALFGALILGPFIIPLLKRIKFGQSIRSQGPKTHYTKAGTPTIGGVIFIVPAAIAAMVFGSVSTDIAVVMFTTLAFGLVGFVDDFIKVAQKRSLGLRANHKLIFELLISTVLAYYVANVKGTGLLVPFSDISVQLGYIFIPFTVFVVIGTANSVNLTDGLDGLLSGIMVIILSGLSIFLAVSGDYPLAVFTSALAGSCLGFLFYNHHPAKVFMGDTGSLALGGALSAIAVIKGIQLYLPVFGLVFVLESLSVIVQVIYYRQTGKRIFKMTPLHHHFELSGYSEPAVVFGFWFITLLASITALAAF
jgi:phospho-N-acetylmuramoyl-pentapeptide-transferase